MADISNITVSAEGVDTVCKIKDKVARNDIAINRTTLGTQCKNLLKNTAVTTTTSGITFTVNADRSITVNGTATSRIIFLVGAAYIPQSGNYTYTGTPVGGSSSTYSMNYRSNGVYKDVDIGNGITAQFDGGKTYEAVIDIRSGVTVSNKTFYPMLRYADITDDTYEPYKESVDERITKNTSDIAVSKSDIALNRTALGYKRKNLLPYPKSIVKGGITFTCDENGYMTSSNTTSDSRQWTSANAQYSMYLEAGTYYFSSFAETVCTNSDGRAYILTGTQTQVVGVSTRETHVEKKFTLANSTKIYVIAKVYDGKVAFMIREADITDDSYEPYSDNVDTRLTENKSNIAINKSTLGYQCKNLLKNTAVTKTVSGITFTVNDDKSVTADGTNSTSNYVNIIVFKDELEAGTYILSGAVSDVFRIRLGVGASADGYGTWAGVDTGNGYKFTVTKKALYTVTCQVESGKTASNVIFKPMLRYADIIDSTFEPYKPSLQEQITELKERIAALGG